MGQLREEKGRAVPAYNGNVAETGSKRAIGKTSTAPKKIKSNKYERDMWCWQENTVSLVFGLADERSPRENSFNHATVPQVNGEGR